MTIRKIPEAVAPPRPQAYRPDIDDRAQARWSAPQTAEADEADTTVSIYQPIGAGYFDDGFTVARMAAALRRIGPRAVTVNINSPGGDMFEGLAIYNLLREHPAAVNVRVMGLAASAASVIAMAADELSVSAASFLMIHNAWGVVVGNRHDMVDAAAVFEQFDGVMRDLYAARTGSPAREIAAMMDAETYIPAAEAVRRGFADRLVNEPQRPAPESRAPRQDNAAALARLLHTIKS
ncbi:peptidase S14, ClpP [Stappia sp. 22II-S9-Z10]|nr:peptidase S14, ClpP [Stappia sp. 22II-S9-Z10]